MAQGALVVGLVLTPLFIWYVREEGDAWITNAVVSTVAFPFWAYVLGAVAFDGFWDGNLAAILLATFTVVSGLIAPRAPKPKRARQKPRHALNDATLIWSSPVPPSFWWRMRFLQPSCRTRGYFVMRPCGCDPNHSRVRLGTGRPYSIP